MIKFLANENFPLPSIMLLRESGCFVRSVAEECPGIPDNDVIRMALDEELVILTFDKDYGEIIFRSGLVKTPSVIFFRYKGPQPAFAGDYVLRSLMEKVDFTRSFTVIEKDNFRQRRYN